MRVTLVGRIDNAVGGAVQFLDRFSSYTTQDPRAVGRRARQGIIREIEKTASETEADMHRAAMSVRRYIVSQRFYDVQATTVCLALRRSDQSSKRARSFRSTAGFEGFDQGLTVRVRRTCERARSSGIKVVAR